MFQMYLSILTAGLILLHYLTVNQIKVVLIQIPHMHRTNRLSSKQNKLMRKAQITLPSHVQKEELIKDPSLFLLYKKAFDKTTDRLKTLNQTTKSISHKSTNKTLLGSSCGQSASINKLLQELRESKTSLTLSSKSPKYYTCKIQQRSKANRPRAECFYPSNKKLGKLQKTIKKLDLVTLFASEFSQMALPSASSLSLRQQERFPLVEIQEEDINLQELRMYCFNSGVKDVQFKLSSHQLIREEIAASKIQKAWKKYRTRMIITRYAQIYSSRLSDSRASQEKEGVFFCPNESELLLSSEDLYDKTNEPRHNRQISDLSCDLREAEKSHYEEEVERIRREQVEQWDEVIGIINSTNHKDPIEIKQLLDQILLKYERKKKDLTQYSIKRSNGKQPLPGMDHYRADQQTNSVQEHNKGAIVKSDVFKLPQVQRPSPQSKSQNSIEMEEYNCSKYVRNLDCDSFPAEQKEYQGTKVIFTQSYPQKHKISKIMQDQLLMHFHINKKSQFCSSISKIPSASTFSHRRQTSESPHKMASARRSLRRVLSLENISLSPSQFGDNEREKCQYHSISAYKTPLGIQYASISQQLAASKQQMVLLERPSHALQFYDSIESQPNPFFKLNDIQQEQLLPEDFVEQVDDVVAAHSQMGCDEQKVREIAILVLNTLILQTLKDISRSELVTRHFKKFARLCKLQVRKVSSGRRKKGFPTDKKQIESFLESIIGYIQTYEPTVFLNLQVPAGPSALEMLRFMHEQQDEGSFSVCEDSQNEASIMVIPNRIFELFWQLKEKSIIVEVPESFDGSDMTLFKQNLQYLKSFNKIFYRSLFDTLNQCLDCHRNFGRCGKPFPWKNTPIFAHTLMDEQIRVEVSQARKQMMEVATSYCGLIIDKEEMEELCGSEEYVAQLQEDRLSRMLASDLVESEHRWTFYDDEETELLVQLSSFAAGCLVLELISQIYSFGLM